MLPDFVVIGAMKAGTTSLFRYLRTHPRVHVPWRKEIDFFSSDENWARGVDWYEEQFAGAGPDQRIGEASPNYSKRHLWPDTPQRLMDTLPGARIIYLVREPIARLQSMYLDMLAYGGETRSIGRALTDSDYILTSCYAMQIEPYIERLGRSRVLVETSERLRSDPTGVMGRVFRFLDLDPAPAGALAVVEANRSEAKLIPTRIGRRVRRWRPGTVDTRKARDMSTTWDRLLVRRSSHTAARLGRRRRRELENRFRADAVRLRELVDIDLSDWPWLDRQ